MRERHRIELSQAPKPVLAAGWECSLQFRGSNRYGNLAIPKLLHR